MRQNIAAGNWKMNLTLTEAEALINDINGFNVPSDVKVILGIPSVYLAEASKIVKDNDSVHVAAQNCHFEEKGAFTGEISIAMLKSIGVKHVIIGHSERREIFGESDAFLKNKMDALVAQNMTPIFCCGEPLEVRESGTQNEYVKKQLENSLFQLEASKIQDIIIAYEPIWAIGTGKTASPEQAQDMHAFLRGAIAAQYSNDVADKISILYGGSVKPNNAIEIFSQKDVEGGLVGGASLKIETFGPIINAF